MGHNPCETLSKELPFHGCLPSNTPNLPFSAAFQRGPPAILSLGNQSPLRIYPVSSQDDDATVEKINNAKDELSADVSLVSGSSDDDLDSSLDASMLSTPVRPFSSPVVDIIRGLGILGISNKDGHGIFDGLGIVSVRSSPWRHGDKIEERQQDSFQDGHITPLSTHNDETSFAADWNISQTLLQETLFTFTEDPFHGHSLTVIPECDSFYEIEGLHLPSSIPMAYRKHDLEHHDLGVRATTPTPDLLSESNFERIRKPVTLSRDVAAPTISSALKRSTSLHCYKSPRASGCTTRSLSTSFSGNQNTGKLLRSLSRSGSPLPRCATPLPSPSGGTPRWRV